MCEDERRGKIRKRKEEEEERKSEVKWIEEEMTVRGIRKEEEEIMKRREECG